MEKMDMVCPVGRQAFKSLLLLFGGVDIGIYDDRIH